MNNKIYLQKYKNIYYAYSNEVFWVISDNGDLRIATVGYYPCKYYRIDQAIDKFNEEFNSPYIIKELVALFDEGKLEGQHFVCYPTERHKETDSRGYIPRTEIEAYSKLSKEIEKKKWEILWKK